MANVQKIQYKYKDIVTNQYPLEFDPMPIIPITVVNAGKSMGLEALVDSGAVKCFSPNEVGFNLGIELENCPKSSLTGLGGTIETRVSSIEIMLEKGRYHFRTDVHFGDFRFYGFSFILGQSGFFENIKVELERRKRSLILFIP